VLYKRLNSKTGGSKGLLHWVERGKGIPKERDEENYVKVNTQ
jgi:hypothetical protein